MVDKTYSTSRKIERFYVAGGISKFVLFINSTMSCPRHTHPVVYPGDRVIVQRRKIGQGRGQSRGQTGTWDGVVDHVVTLPADFPYHKVGPFICNVFVQMSPDDHKEFLGDKARGHKIRIRPRPGQSSAAASSCNLWIISSIDYEKNVVRVYPMDKVTIIDEQSMTEISIDDIASVLIWPDGFTLTPVHQVELLRPPPPSYIDQMFCDAIV